jgi:hypothetical protein
MSFIDLMSSNVFTDSEITRRTELMIRTYFTEEEELILNRKLSAKITGVYTPTPEEEAEFVQFGMVAMQAQQEGIAARADNTLLIEILHVEPSFLRLRQPLVEPIYEDEQIINQEEIDLNIAERADAQVVVDSASGEVMEWIEKRNPVVEENP